MLFRSASTSSSEEPSNCDAGRFLEVHVARGRLHLVFHGHDHAHDLLARELGELLVDLGGVDGGGLVDDGIHDVVDRLADGLRLDAVLDVVLLLDFPAAARFGDGAVHGVGLAVGVHDDLARNVARRAAYGLDQRPVVAQKAFLVGVEDGNERDLGQVEALAQQVDAHERVERALAQLAQYLHAFERADVGMHVARLDALVEQVVGEVFGHLLGEGGDQRALALRGTVAHFVDDVVDLRQRRPYLDEGVEQARRTDDLLDAGLADLLLVVARRGRDVDELRYAVLELVEAQRPVVEGRRKAEAVLGKRDLARSVALVHAADLRDADVALVDDAQEVAREVVDEGVGRLAGRTPVHMARIVLDARAEAHGLQHLEVVVRAHLQALRLEQLAFVVELLQAVAQFVADGADGAVHLRARRDVVRRRPHGKRVVRVEDLARDAVDFGYLLDLVAPEVDADGVVGIGREHVERVAAHAERAALQLVVVAVVLDVDEVVNHVALVEEHRHARVVLRRSDAVDAADGGHHDDVAARQQRRRGRMAQLLDLLVDGGVLLDERVGGGNVGLGLVVVVVGDEVHHGVVGKHLLELGGELRCKRFVGRQDKRGALDGLDDLGHGERLARPGDAEQRLVAQAVLDALRQLLDRLRLVARRLVGRHHLERRVGKAAEVGLALHFYAFDVLKMSGQRAPFL